mgnify:CR=1 FL=1
MSKLYSSETYNTSVSRFMDALGPDAPRVGLSIGIASRRAGSDEALDSQKRRADMAMYEVKRHGRGHWRVSLERGRS